MQIDFHHGVTYVVARLAGGFDHPQASIIAHCAQYVDDATNSGLILFDNGVCKERFPYHLGFLQSDWKLFNDALKAHRFYVTHELLPQYGICVA